MTLFPVYLIVLVVFVNRYVLGLYLKKAKGRRFDQEATGYEPTVTIVIPMFNEGEGIFGTIQSLLEQDYPKKKLSITVVDDCSTDDSLIWARLAAIGEPRVTVLKNRENIGKRRSINHAVRRARSEIIVSVDSDVVVDTAAVRRLVARFTHPKIAAVGGRVNVSNANENWLTRMQAIKYYFGYEYLKNLERALHSVMCLSGCLTAYRRSVLIQLEPILENRNAFGVAIKYGEDRYLTRQIVKAGYQTVSTLDAICYTVAPNTLSKYFSQQLRWRRSNIIDFLAGLSHAWKLHPLVAVHYLSMFAMLICYPTVIVQNVVSEQFWDLAFLNLPCLALLGALYWFDTRKAPAAQRVHPLYFLPMVFVMPVTYLLFTPLAAFTLDSSSWETRGKPLPKPAPAREHSLAAAAVPASL